MNTYEDIDFIGYHVSVLNRTVSLPMYRKIMDMSFYKTLSIDGNSDIPLVMEMFGPYFNKNVYGLLLSQLYLPVWESLLFKLWYEQTSFLYDDVALFLNRNQICNQPLSYDVSAFSGFCVLGREKSRYAHIFVSENMPIMRQSVDNVPFIYIVQDYIDYTIYEFCLNIDVTYNLEQIVYDSFFMNKLIDRITFATLSHSHSCFYKKIRSNLLYGFLEIMGDESINPLAIITSYDDVWDFNIFHQVKDNSVTYGDVINVLISSLEAM